MGCNNGATYIRTQHLIRITLWGLRFLSQVGCFMAQWLAGAAEERRTMLGRRRLGLAEDDDDDTRPTDPFRRNK